VKQVFHPALHDHPGHALWRRDFTGSNGLLSFELCETDVAYVERLLNPVLRLHVGLEDVADLIEDLQRGFAALERDQGCAV
jgi:cystathionine beta-lyase